MNAPLDRPESLPRMYRALWTHAAGRRHLFLVAFGFLLCSQLIMLAVPWLSAQAIDAIQQGGTAQLGEAGRWLLLVVVATVASWLFHGPGRIVERNLAMTVYERLADRLMLRLFAAPLSWHQRHHSGETLHRVKQSAGALYDFAQSQYIYLQNTVKILGPVTALWLISPLVGLAATWICRYCATAMNGCHAIGPSSASCSGSWRYLTVNRSRPFGQCSTRN